VVMRGLYLKFDNDMMILDIVAKQKTAQYLCFT